MACKFQYPAMESAGRGRIRSSWQKPPSSASAWRKRNRCSVTTSSVTPAAWAQARCSASCSGLSGVFVLRVGPEVEVVVERGGRFPR